MPGFIYFLRKLIDPATGQMFDEIDPIRAQIGSGTQILPAGVPADVTLLTVPAGKKFIMTSMSWNPTGIGVGTFLRIFEGPSATGTLKLQREQIAAALTGITEVGLAGYEFTSDVVAREVGILGGTIEVGGYLLDIEPQE